MPRNQLTKAEILTRVLKLKHGLFTGSYGNDWSPDQKKAAHFALDQILNAIEEYRY